jgi:hypothetical protein
MPTIQLQLVKPHASQLLVLKEAKRFNTLACGRQFGKTTLALEIVVEAALQGKATAWFNPTYKSNDAAWESLKETLRQLITDTNEQARRIQVAGGGSAECWSLIDPDSGRGRQYDLVVIDEAGQVPALQHAWEKSIRPMLAARQGKTWFLVSARCTVSEITRQFHRFRFLILFQGAPASIELFLNGFHHRGPHEGLGILVPSLEEGVDGRLQIGDAEEDAAADGLVIQMAEPALDKIQPARTGGHEVRHESGISVSAIPFFGVLVPGLTSNI